MKSNKELTPIEFARKLRRQPTSSEVSLWHALRNRRRGFKFRRQHSVGPFVADFFCLEAKLVVESDGKDHFTETGLAHDAFRDLWMQRHGIEVLRFSGNQIDQELERVLAIIDAKLEERTGAQGNDAREKALHSDLVAAIDTDLATEEDVGDSTSQPSPPAPSPVRTGEGVPEASTLQAPSVASSLPPLTRSYDPDSSLPPLARSYGRGVGGEGLPLSREPRTSKHDGHARGFTLVELLAVIVIIGILSSLVIQALNSARQDALAASTRGTIAKIDSVLAERMNEYLSKPLFFAGDSAVEILRPDHSGTGTTNAVVLESFPVKEDAFVARKPDNAWSNNGNYAPISLLRERVRVAAVRDLMRMEMPDCVGDLFESGYNRPTHGPPPSILPSSPNVKFSNPLFIWTGFITSTNLPVMQRLRPPAGYRRILQKVWDAEIDLSRRGIANTRWADQFPNEELLFLIVEDSFIAGVPAIENFVSREIGDVDGDGLREFIDSWGKPIRWIRWPSGLASTVPFDPDPLGTTGGSDAFDPAQVDIGFDPVNSSVTNALPGYMPRPLVISAGSDGRFGRRFYTVDSTSTQSPFLSPCRFEPTSSTTPKAPLSAAGVPRYAFTDPFYPRTSTTDDPKNFKLGGVLTQGTDTDPVGVDLNPGNPAFQIDTSLDDKYVEHLGDNISNLDESGASL